MVEIKRVSSFKDPHNNPVSAEKQTLSSGRQWSYDKNDLKSHIQSLKNIGKSVFEGIKNQEVNDNREKIDEFKKNLIDTNLKVHAYNNRISIRFLSLFTNKYKIETLDKEIDELGKLISEVDRVNDPFKNLREILNKFNERIKKKIGTKVSVDYALFRIPGSRNKVDAFVAAVNENKPLNFDDYSDDDLASGIKKIITELPKNTKETFKPFGKTNNIDDARQAFSNLSNSEKTFARSFIDLLANTYDYSWKDKPNMSIDVMLLGAVFAGELLPNSSFLIKNREQIFNN